MKNEVIYVGSILESNSYGKFEIITIQGNKVTLRFIETGYTYEKEKVRVRKGQVRDWSLSGQAQVGKVFHTKNYGDCTLVEYNSASSVRVIFNKTGTEVWTRYQALKEGQVADPYAPSVAGVGFLGVGLYTPHNNPTHYRKWAHMLHRCYVEYDRYKCYYDKTVCIEWHNFQNFTGWALGQIGCENKGWELDKDILVRDNKEYGPESCCYVPKVINTTIAKAVVTGHKTGNKYYFSCNEVGTTKKSTAYFTEQSEGILWVNTKKSLWMQNLAENFKDQLDPKVYDVLSSWVYL